MKCLWTLLFGRMTSEQALQEGHILPPGLLSVRKDQAFLLRLSYQDGDKLKYLSGEETTELLTRLGAQFFNEEVLAKVTTEEKFGSLAQKSPKRITASIADRNFAMRQQDVSLLVEELAQKTSSQFKSVAPNSFENTFLFFDPALETTLKAFGLEDSYTKFLLEKAGGGTARKEVLRQRLGTRIVMSSETNQSALQYFRTTLEAQGLGEDALQELNTLMQEQVRAAYSEKGGAISLNDIIAKINSKADALSDPEIAKRYRSYTLALGEMKKIDDGSSFVSQTPFRMHAETLRDNIKSLDERINSLPANSEELKTLTASRQSFKSQLEKIVTNVDDFLIGKKMQIRSFQDQTLRLLIGKGQGKAVADLVSSPITKLLERLGFFGAGSNELFKSEISFARFVGVPGREAVLGANAGQQFTMEIFTGHGSDRVLTEPQAMIFHREMYGSHFGKQVEEIAAKLDLEVKNIKEGKVSERLKRSIMQDANIDIDGGSDNLIERFGSRANAIRIRNEARELQRIILSRDFKLVEMPEILNKLVEQAQRNAFRNNKTYKVFAGGQVQDRSVFNLEMPYAQRNAIDTEERHMRGFTRKILGNDEESTFSRITTEAGDKLNLFKYRLTGHKMLIPKEASTSFGLYEAAGGFDLDDKFITNLGFIRDQNQNRRLVAFAWRQPTGPQEFALLSPYLDDDTLTRMFGSDSVMSEKFKSVAEEMSNSINERTGYILRMAEGSTEQLDAVGLEMLSREDKIFKYLNAIAHGETRAANFFKQSLGQGGATQEELERAIFALVDFGGEGRFNIGEISSVITSKLSGSFSSTPLQLTAEEIAKTGDLGLIAAYKQSKLTQLLGANTTIPQDPAFISRIRDVSGLTDLEGSNVFKTASDILKEGQNVTATNAQREAAMQVKMAYEELYQRLQISSMGAKDNLGIYVNRLGWAVSSEEQRVNAINSLRSKMNTKQFRSAVKSISSEGDYSTTLKSIKGLLNDLYAETSLVFNPEGAIDVAVGSKVKQTLAASYGDLYKVYQLSLQDGVPETVAKRALNNALFRLAGSTEDNIDKLNNIMTNIPGVRTRISASNYQEVFNKLVSGGFGEEAAKEVMKIVDISAANVGLRMIEDTARQMGQIRALQMILPDFFDDKDLIGIDKFTSQVKLAAIAAEDRIF